MEQRNHVEVEKLNPYLISLFALLSSATVFEGFDAAMLSFAAPDVRLSLGMSLDEWGFISGLTRMGVLASFFFMLSADRWGRRSIMMVTVGGFAIANGFTAFVETKTEFVITQFFARLFLTAEYALAVIIIGEEYPTRLRGRAIAILTSLSTVGVMIMAKIQPFILLPEGAEGGWLHETGMLMVHFGQSFLGLEQESSNWRALYALGAVPLILIFGLRMTLRETRRFELEKEKKEDLSLRVGWAEHWKNANRPWEPRYRKRTAIVTLLWNCTHLVTAPSVVYWVIYAREELGLTTSQVGDIVFWGYGGGVAGHFVAGWLLDRVGRRFACSAFYIVAAIPLYWLYHHPTLVGQYFWMTATVFSFAAAMTATHVYASELFPTEIRATGYGWTTNFLGRITEIATPMIIGALILPLGGIPNAIALVALGPIFGAVLVLLYAPETRGLTLEEIQIKLDSESGMSS